MAKLTQQEVGDRLRCDYRVAMDMKYNLMDLAAYASQADATEQRNPILPEHDLTQARFYRAQFHIKTLSGRGKTMDRTDVLIDLLGGGNYPYSMPGTWVLSRPLPWSPHFKEGQPICIESSVWTERKLLGDLLIYVAQLLNFHEAVRGGYEGWNGEAQNYWVHELKGEPITPGLQYPTMPQWVNGPLHNQPEFSPRQGQTVARADSFNPRK
jgi:hypothetical protein